MDPGPLTQSITMDPTVAASLIALAIILAETVKQLLTWIIDKKFGGTKKMQVHLDPEVSKIVHETGDQVTGISAVVTRVDQDGVPMVYADKKLGRTTEKIVELLKELTDSQRRLAESMKRLDERFENHDRSDAITFARMVDAQERLENIAGFNRDAISGIRREHEVVKQKLDQIIDNQKG